MVKLRQIPWLLIAIVIVGLMGIKVNAASADSDIETVDLTYNRMNKSLTGYVISKYPQQIQIDIQYENQTQETYSQSESMILLGYDDDGEKYYKVYYTLGLKGQPTQITITDGVTRVLQSTSTDRYLKYQYRENLYLSMARFEVETYALSEVITSNTVLYSFIPTTNEISGMEMEFFRNINHGEVSETDFVLKDTQTGEMIEVEWVEPIYCVDEITKSKISVDNGLQIKFSENLIRNHKYEFMTSNTVTGNEFAGGENLKSRVRIGNFYRSFHVILEEELWNLMVVNSSKELSATRIEPPISEEPPTPEEPPTVEEPPILEEPPTPEESPTPQEPMDAGESATRNESTVGNILLSPKTGDDSIQTSDGTNWFFRLCDIIWNIIKRCIMHVIHF